MLFYCENLLLFHLVSGKNTENKNDNDSKILYSDVMHCDAQF